MQKLARGRIKDLMQFAKEKHPEDPELANHYVTLARKIAMGTKVKIPLDLKRYICHNCKELLVPGKNMRFRINSKKHYGTYLSVTCLSCGHITRYMIKGRAKRKSEVKIDDPSQSKTDFEYNSG
ncbi:MAG: ribonuclease P protein component 4 [Promethearchaeota archaeon]